MYSEDLDICVHYERISFIEFINILITSNTFIYLFMRTFKFYSHKFQLYNTAQLTILIHFITESLYSFTSISFFMYLLAIWMSSLGKYLFRSFAHF